MESCVNFDLLIRKNNIYEICFDIKNINSVDRDPLYFFIYRFVLNS